MLGRLQMTTVQALTKYKDIAGKIFGEDNKKWRFQDGMYKASTLETEIRRIVEEQDKGKQMFDKNLPRDFSTLVGAWSVQDIIY